MTEEVDQRIRTKLERTCLAYAGQTSIGPVPPIVNEPEFFFSGRSGLVMGRFFHLVIMGDFCPPGVGKGIEASAEVYAATSSVAYYDLARMAHDDAIQRALPEKLSVFEFRDGLQSIVGLVHKQQHGERGPLLTNAYGNLFYLRRDTSTMIVVRVRYQGEWYIDDWGFNALQSWRKGDRVFVPADVSTNTPK